MGGVEVWGLTESCTFRSMISLFFVSSSIFSGSPGVSTASLPDVTLLLSAAEASPASAFVSGVVEYHFGRNVREVGNGGIRDGGEEYLEGRLERIRGSLELRARDCRISDR